MFEQVQSTLEQVPNTQVPIEVVYRDLGDITLGIELYDDENIETRMDAEEGKNPNPECPHGNDVAKCTVCNSRDGSSNQDPEESESLADDYMLAA